MGDIVPSDLFNGIGVVGLVLLFFWLLATGRICTGRELREKNDHVKALERALRVRDQQLALVLTEAMTTLNPVLNAMRDAARAEPDTEES